MSRVDYDPAQFRGSAPYYLRGRPPYSRDLGEVLRTELDLDGHGTLVDVGAGPGSVSLSRRPGWPLRRVALPPLFTTA